MAASTDDGDGGAMGSTTFTQVTGWLLAAVVVTTIAAAYLLRRATRPPKFLVRMRPHFWLGGSVPVIAMIHLWPSMSTGMAAEVNKIGLYLATVAFFLTILQVFLGSQLRSTQLTDHASLRRQHRLTMVGIVFFAAAHMIANSGLFG